MLPLTAEPKEMLFINLFKLTLTPYLENSSSNFCDLLLPLPKVKKKKPSGVNSLTNLLSVLIYLPTFIPGSSAGVVGSISKISDSAKASTSYHLLSLAVINSKPDGNVVYPKPSFCMIDVTPNTFLSGKNNLKNGLLSMSVISFLNIFVTPFTTTSLLVIV